MTANEFERDRTDSSRDQKVDMPVVGIAQSLWGAADTDRYTMDDCPSSVVVDAPDIPMMSRRPRSVLYRVVLSIVLVGFCGIWFRGALALLSDIGWL